ncbi:MAG: hypothetical protein M1836_007576 [Candelina mexicana]|nr:MAG: hypothetical protein M1836_007576 [Candelina mexicana]
MYFHYFVFLFLSLAVFATEEDDLNEQAARFFKIVQEIKIVQVKRDPQSSNNSNDKLGKKVPFVRILKGILHPCDFAQLPADLINDIGNDVEAGASVVSQIVHGQNPTFLKSIPTAIAGEIVSVAKEIPKIPEEILDAIEEGAEEAGDIISQIAHGQVPTQLKSMGDAIVTAAKSVFNDIGNLIEGNHPTSTSKKTTTSAAACVKTTAPQTTTGTTTVTTHATTTVNTAAAAASASNALKSSLSVAAASSAARASASSSALSSYYKASSSYYASISAAQATAVSRSTATTSIAPFTPMPPSSFSNAGEAESSPTPVGGAAAGSASPPSSNSAASTPSGSAGAQPASNTTAAPSSVGADRPSAYIVASLAGLIAILGFVFLL